MIRTLLTKSPDNTTLVDNDLNGLVVTHPTVPDAADYLTVMRINGYDGVIVDYDRGELLMKVAEFLQRNYAPSTLTEREWAGEAELLLDLIEKEMVAK